MRLFFHIHGCSVFSDNDWDGRKGKSTLPPILSGIPSSQPSMPAG
jgi:hypothetical protein